MQASTSVLQVQNPRKKKEKEKRNPISKLKQDKLRSFKTSSHLSMDFITTPGMPNSANIITASNQILTSSIPQAPLSSRYENQKRRDWTTFCQYLRSHRPPLSLPLCSSAHVLEFLRYLDQFGKTKVHNETCPFFGIPSPPAPCPCPLRQAWGSLDALIGRLRAAYEEQGGLPEANPFGARGVRLFLRDVRDFQSKSRGISYEKKRKRAKFKVAMESSEMQLLEEKQIN